MFVILLATIIPCLITGLNNTTVARDNIGA